MTDHRHDSSEMSSITCTAGTIYVKAGQTATLTNTEDGWVKTGTARGSLYEQGNAAPDGSRWVAYGNANAVQTRIDELPVGDSVTVTVSEASTNGV
jgi:hypothetical protein